MLHKWLKVAESRYRFDCATSGGVLWLYAKENYFCDTTVPGRYGKRCGFCPQYVSVLPPQYVAPKYYNVVTYVIFNQKLYK